VVASLYLILSRRLLKEASQQGRISYEGDGSVSDSSPVHFFRAAARSRVPTSAS
jgi:hypothetical protein